MKSQDARSLAIFDDDTVGFLVNHYGRGKACLLGLSYTEAVLLPQIGKDYEAQRKYVNSIEPSADVIMLIIRAIYDQTKRLEEIERIVRLDPEHLDDEYNIYKNQMEHVGS